MDVQALWKWHINHLFRLPNLFDPQTASGVVQVVKGFWENRRDFYKSRRESGEKHNKKRTSSLLFGGEIVERSKVLGSANLEKLEKKSKLKSTQEKAFQLL